MYSAYKLNKQGDQRKQWQPNPVLLPGKSHGQRSLVGCSPWGGKELYTTEQLNFHFSLSCIGEGSGNPLQCSCLENPRDRGAWWAAVYGVAQSRTWLKRLSSSSSSKQGDNIQLWCTPFPILNQSIVPCPALIVASWPAYRFPRRQARWTSIPIFKNFSQFVVIHTVKGFRVVNEAEVDFFFLEFSCFFYDPVNVGSLICSYSGSFITPACLSENSQFTYCWSLALRILSITLLACEMSKSVW